ncbi:MAG: DNA repair protein [Lachnospiraceae bacterium]|nr:DNA repair protein [Lachnospiraceae bacterium]
MAERIYMVIDLKSFYASVECVERGLDPMTTNLVVADPDRTKSTVCLAITPPMKELGLHSRCRVFQIPEGVHYITAPPRMQLYIQYAADIYSIYLKYISKEDIHVYSIDEVFLDVTDYISMYRMDAEQLARTIMEDILQETGVRATCGIGTNLYLAKVALDITAKHSPDFIGFLDETSYQKNLWNHRPLTDFWRVGKGTATRLAQYGIYTMKDIAHAKEDFLYQLFGIDAELLIDHAWGREPVTMADIKAYHSKENSIGSGQILPCDYSFADGRLAVREMMDLLCLDLVEKQLVTSSITLQVGYSNGLHLNSARGTAALPTPSNADLMLLPAVTTLYEQIVDPRYPVRRLYLTCNRVVPEEYHQYSFFVAEEDLTRNRKLQQTMINIKKRFGKNAILKGMNLEEHATTRERNQMTGGHRSGT